MAQLPKQRAGGSVARLTNKSSKLIHPGRDTTATPIGGPLRNKSVHFLACLGEIRKGLGRKVTVTSQTVRARSSEFELFVMTRFRRRRNADSWPVSMLYARRRVSRHIGLPQCHLSVYFLPEVLIFPQRATSHRFRTA